MIYLTSKTWVQRPDLTPLYGAPVWSRATEKGYDYTSVGRGVFCSLDVPTPKPVEYLLQMEADLMRKHAIAGWPTPSLALTKEAEAQLAAVPEQQRERVRLNAILAALGVDCEIVLRSHVLEALRYVVREDSQG